MCWWSTLEAHWWPSIWVCFLLCGALARLRLGSATRRTTPPAVSARVLSFDLLFVIVPLVLFENMEELI